MTKKGGGPLREGSARLSPIKSIPLPADHRARVINMPRSMAATTKTAGEGNYKSPSRRPIKKAHVRFDDYLDLNEENMRRSCKRLMNRLYHATPSSDSQQPVVDAACPTSVATKNTCRSVSPPPLLIQVGDEIEQTIISKSATTTTMSPGGANRIIADNTTSGYNVIASSMISELPPTNEKSYLRSQYERRQKRQIELMHQQQQLQQNHGQTMATKLNLTAAAAAADARSCNQNDNNEMTSVDSPGANNNICRQQHHQRQQQQEQQDLVAKSHELSKRRFFEKLERRESMKNSTPPSTQDERQLQLASGARAFKHVQQPQSFLPPSSDHRRKQQQMLPTKANIGKENLSSGEDEKSKIFQEPVKHRELIARGGGGSSSSSSGMVNKSYAADAQSDEQLMLKVYQSMVAAGASQSPAHDMTAARAVCTNAQPNLPSRTGDGPPLKLPPTGTQPSLYGCVRGDLLATELIGLHTSTPQQRLLDEATAEAIAGKSLSESQRTNLGVPCRSAAGDDDNNNDDEQHSLIEFSKGQQKHSLDTSEQFCSSSATEMSEQTDSGCSKTMQRQCESQLDDSSAFEIKVPADLSGSLDQVDSASCFIDRLLVVKQVRSDDDHAETGPAPPLSGCNNRGRSIESVDRQPATSKSTTQLEGNKASINLMAAVSSSLPDNEINDRMQQIKEAAAQVPSSLPDGLLATIEEEATTGTGDGVSSVHKVTADLASAAEAVDAGTDADEAAASLETIITNKRETRDVPPEANAVTELLKQQQSNNARRTVQPTPLNHCDMQDNEQDKVSKSDDSSSEVDREIEDERAQTVGQVAALELKEIAKVDQGGSLEGHHNKHAVEDEHEQREQALWAATAVNKEQDQYANPSSDQSAIAAAAFASSQGNHAKNNVNHDPSRVDEEASSGSSQERARMQQQPLPSHCENVVGINLISEERGRANFMDSHSIEPSHNAESPISPPEQVNVSRNERLVSSSSSIDPSAEEDVGSSCSSSGFGASVSATSSASSSDDRRSHHHKTFKDDKQQPTYGAHGGHYRRPNSMAQKNSLYDSLRAVSRKCDETLRSSSSALAEQNDQLHYKQVVGPDQAYPDNRSGRPMLVENYGYASLTGRYRFSAPLPELPPRIEGGHVASAAAKTKESLELDPYSTVLYANLPASLRMQRSPIVEYATVTAASRNGGPANIPPAENKRYSASARAADRRHHHHGQSNSTEPPPPVQAQRSDDCESSLSGSANSGGFSMLPPVRLIDHNFANNSDFSKSLEPSLSIYGESTATSQHRHHQQEPAKKSASLFKRFGSLVSRAFTSTSSNVAGNECGSSVHLSTDGTTTPHSLSNASQSLSLHVNGQKCGPPSRAHEQHVSAITIARREHKSGGGAAEADSGNQRDTLYATATRAKVVHHHTATDEISGKINKTPLAMAEADLVILPTKHSKDNQQRKNDTYGGVGGVTLRHSHKNITIATAAVIPRDCNRAKKEDARAKRNSRDASEQRQHSRRTLGLSPRSTSISIASSYSSSSLDCTSSSERYGPTSLIDQSHANSDMRLNECPRGRAKLRHYARLGGGREIVSTHDTTARGESSSMLYASLQQARSLQITDKARPCSGRSWRKLATDEDTSSDNEADGALAERSNELVVNEDGKCRSLNLYQNLMRNYVKRRHHRHHHHHGHNRGHHHHHHHHTHGHSHHHKHLSSARHAHCSSTTRCGQQCLALAAGGRVVCSSLSEQSSYSNKNQSSISGAVSRTADKRTMHGDKASVWGQLIKINKSDGSQVIELQRAPSRSWGFFVARGAINNIKGIFISRVHDNATGSSLTGLLGIGDRILSIDNCAIEPDDIMRVNQMISKKNKILLRVKPFKG